MSLNNLLRNRNRKMNNKYNDDRLDPLTSLSSNEQFFDSHIKQKRKFPKRPILLLIASLALIISIASIVIFFTRDSQTLAKIGNDRITKTDLDKKIALMSSLGLTSVNKSDILTKMINCKVVTQEAARQKINNNSTEINQSINDIFDKDYPFFTNNQRKEYLDDIKCQVLSDKIQNNYLAWASGSYISLKNPITYISADGKDSQNNVNFSKNDLVTENLANQISSYLKEGKVNMSLADSMVANANFTDGQNPKSFSKDDFIRGTEILSDNNIKLKIFNEIKNHQSVNSESNSDANTPAETADIQTVDPVVVSQTISDSNNNTTKEWLVININQFKEGGYKSIDDLNSDLYKTYKVEYRFNTNSKFSTDYPSALGNVSVGSDTVGYDNSNSAKVEGASTDCSIGSLTFDTPSASVKDGKTYAPVEITFNTTTGTNTNYYLWNFGDPDSVPHATASGSNKSYPHTYDYKGNYTITLNAYHKQSDGTLISCGSKTKTIELAGPAAPETGCSLDDIKASPQSGKNPLDVSFSSSGNANVNYYHWSFGDPYSASGEQSASGNTPNKSHTYSTAGTFSATLTGYRQTASENTNCGTKTIGISVTGPLIPPPTTTWNLQGQSLVDGKSSETVSTGTIVKFTHDIWNTGPNNMTTAFNSRVWWESGSGSVVWSSGWGGNNPSDPLPSTFNGHSALNVNQHITYIRKNQFTIPSTAKPGDRFCQEISFTWQTGSGSTPEGNSSPACATVASGYTLTPSVNPIKPHVADIGSPLTVTTDVKNYGPINSDLTNVVLYRTVNHGSWVPIPEPSQIFNYGDNSGPSYTDNATAGLSVGDQVCFKLSVNPHSSSDNTIIYSTEQCAFIGKSPKTQVLGGDLIVGGDVNTSFSQIGNTYYGSWAEYGIIASGGISGAASGAAFAGPGGLSTYSPNNPVTSSQLSFANTPPFINCSKIQPDVTPTGGCYKSDVVTPNIAASFPVTNSTPLTSSFDLSNLSSGTYTASGTITITGGNILAGTSIIINAPTATVKITGNITYDTSTPLSSISNIPQVVIIAKNIYIYDFVSSTITVNHIDAWLIAQGQNGATDGVINTCFDVAPGANLSAGLCKDVLTVNGPVMTDNLYLRRTAGSGTSASSGDPAEVFNLPASAYLWSMYQASSSKSNVQTVYGTEMPPRY